MRRFSCSIKIRRTKKEGERIADQLEMIIKSDEKKRGKKRQGRWERMDGENRKKTVLMSSNASEFNSIYYYYLVVAASDRGKISLIDAFNFLSARLPLASPPSSTSSSAQTHIPVPCPSPETRPPTPPPSFKQYSAHFLARHLRITCLSPLPSSHIMVSPLWIASDNGDAQQVVLLLKDIQSVHLEIKGSFFPFTPPQTFHLTISISIYASKRLLPPFIPFHSNLNWNAPDIDINHPIHHIPPSISSCRWLGCYSVSSSRQKWSRPCS